MACFNNAKVNLHSLLLFHNENARTEIANLIINFEKDFIKEHSAIIKAEKQQKDNREKTFPFGKTSFIHCT